MPQQRWARLATRILAGTFILCLVASCGGNDGYKDIRDFMQKVEDGVEPRIAPIPERDEYRSFSYGASNLRSPFVPQVKEVIQTEEQIRNSNVKPPKNHNKQFLERFNLALLQMVGTLKQNATTWALIQDADGGVHRVQVGDYMGTSWGKIDSISDSRIDITEIVSDGKRGWLRKPRSIELSGN
ncbi:MAG: pilus assembly protein PilP [Pseudomonadales bacterium]|nr:pilus assembly protein PilP [Pseudomonadales bacterium]